MHFHQSLSRCAAREAWKLAPIQCQGLKLIYSFLLPKLITIIIFITWGYGVGFEQPIVLRRYCVGFRAAH